MQRPNLFWLALLMLTCCTSAAFAQELQVAPGQPKSVNTFGRVEWSIDPGVKYHNPFDPAEVSIDATFTAPTGSAVTVPAFWSDPAFTVRFAPSEPGNWSFIASITDRSGRRVSQPRPFSVQPSQRPGFIRRATNNRYLRFDSGQSYFPVGINLCWPPGDAAYASWYDGAFQTLADNGANYVRIWMCTDQAMLESAKTGLGRYDLAHAESFDKVLASAEEHGIGVMLCMMNHRELLNRDMWGPAGWPTHPYNAHNGGPATRPIDFFTNPDAQRDFKARLRYIVARYSAYTSIAFWELFNEQEFARVEVPLDWNRQMTDYLRQLDPAKHLITTSAAVPPAVWELPSIDLTQLHIYGDGTQLDMVTPIANSVSDAERFNKPHLIGEMGLDNKGPDTRYDPTGKGTTFHNSLWAGMFSGSAGSGIYWWWDNYVGPKNLWHEFKPVSEFTSHIDWAGNHFVPIPITQLWRSDVSDTLADLTILPASAWGATQRQTVTIPINGRPTTMVPRYLCGPSHGDLHSPLTFELDLPQASELVLGFAQVSDCAMVRVSIDGKPLRDFAFSALPGSANTENAHLSQENQIYQADVKDEYRLPIAAGHHKVKLETVAGDWVTLSRITFTHALAARYAGLLALGLQDSSTHETLVWILNTKSNWKDDQTQDAPQPLSAVELTVPNIDSGNYIAQWSDTRGGGLIRSDQTTAQDGRLSLHVPAFNRDIALRLQRSKS